MRVGTCGRICVDMRACMRQPSLSAHAPTDLYTSIDLVAHCFVVFISVHLHHPSLTICSQRYPRLSVYLLHGERIGQWVCVRARYACLHVLVRVLVITLAARAFT